MATSTFATKMLTISKFFPAILSLFILCAPNPVKGDDSFQRFFLMGSGDLHLKNLRNNREAHLQLLDSDGLFNVKALDKADWIFGFPTKEKEEHISPRLLFMLSYFADQTAPGRTINIESAYRSPDYNAKLRAKGVNAARTSTHIDGMALDFWIEGIDGKELWQTVREKQCCGVGHYGGKTIHLDAGRPRFWEAATSGTRSTEPDYNRHVYLTTEYDRYRAGEKVRFSLSGISNFEFGIRPRAILYAADAPGTPAARIALAATASLDCLQLGKRKASRLIHATLPSFLPAGRYTAQLEFCRKPFPQMPDGASSGEFEIVAAAGGN